MFDKGNLGDYNRLKEYVTSLFPNYPLAHSISTEDQQYEIELLKNTLGSQRFFFVVDLQKFELEHLHGVQRWLGYSEKNFNLSQYWSLVHPGRQKSLMNVAIQLYTALCSGKYSLQFLVQRYASIVVLKHYKGHYISAKKTASVFQYDSHNRLVAYLNEFTIIGEYDGEALNPTFFTSAGNEEDRGNEVIKKAMEHFLGMKVFSYKELQIARILAYEPGATQVSIATNFGLSIHTIDTFCRRFLHKARDFFHRDFSSVTDAAIFLKKEGLL